MSTVIDEKIVSMKFDNKDFEKNTQVTMNSLRQLENTAADSGLKIQDVWLKTASVFEYQVARRLINAATNVAKALTIEPVTTGLQEYETQIGAIQTILSNTKHKGSTLDDVNKALDELNVYADKTIYNFTEMTKNIGTFTAAGVELDTSVSAIKGIANLAAVSGSTSQQASTAMYQLSQALANGKVRLQDWNSVVNAGMGGEVFQNALKETARVHGVAIDEIIESNGSFRESLQEDWLTTDILTETLEKFTYSAEKGSEEWNELVKSLQAKGYTKAQAEEIIELGNDATDAATKVKTATQLFSTLKETAQSGWTQTWEIIIGDFEEAKKLWSSIYEVAGGLIDKMSSARNTFLEGALGSEWDKLLGKGIFDEEGFQTKIKNVAKEVGVSFDDMINKGMTFEEALREALSGDKFKPEHLASALESLTTHYSNYTDEQLENEGITKEQVENLQKLNLQFRNGDINVDELAKSLQKLSGRELALQGLANIFKFIGDILKPIGQAFGEIFEAKPEGLYNTLNAFHEFSLKLQVTEDVADKIKRTFKGLFAAFDIGWMVLKSVITLVAKVTSKLFGLSGGILDITAALGDSIVSFRDFLKRTDTFGKFSETVLAVFEGIGAALREFFDVLHEKFHIPKLDEVGGVFVKLWNTISGVAHKIAVALKEVFVAIKEFVTSNFDVSNLENAIDLLISGVIGGGLIVLIKKVIDFFENFEGFKDLISGFADVIQGITEPLEAMTQSVKADALIRIATAVGILIGSIIILSFIDKDKINHALTSVGILLGLLISALFLINRMSATINKSKIVNRVKGMGSTFTEIKETFSSTGKDLMQTTRNITSLIGLAAAVFILALAMKKISTMSWPEIWKGIAGVTLCIVALLGAVAMMKLIDKIDGETQVAKMLGLAGLLVIMCIPFKILSTLEWDDIWKGLTAMGSALGGLLAALALMKVINKMDSETSVFTLLGLVGVLTIVAISLKCIGKMEWDQIWRGLTGLGVALGGLVGALALIKLIGKIDSTNKELVKMVGLAGMLYALARTLKLLSNIDEDGIKRGLMGLVGIMGVLLVILYSLSVMERFDMGVSIKSVWELVIISGALTALSVVLIALSHMSWPQIAKGLVAMTGALTCLIGTMALLGLVERYSASTLKSAISIAILAGALGIIATELVLLGHMNWPMIGRSLVAMGGALAILAGTMTVLGLISRYTGGGLGLVASAAAMVILAGALMLLIPVIATLGNMKVSTIKQALLTIAAAIGVLALTSILVQSALPAMLGLASVIALIGGACLLAGIGVSAFSVGLTLLIQTLTTVTAEGAQRMADAIIVIIKSIASTIPFLVEVIGQAIIKFCEFIIAAAPVIGRAIISVLKAVIELLVEIVPDLAYALCEILIAVLDALVEFLPSIVEALFKLIIGIINKIADYIPELTQAFVNIFIKVFQGFGEAFKNADGNALQEGFDAIGLLVKMMLLLNAVMILLPGAMLGVIALGVIAAEMALVFAALGKLAQIDGLIELVGEGGGLLQAVGTAIGKFVGGIVGGIAEGISTALPAIGTNLSQFMTNLKPFLDGISLLDATVLENAKTLAQVILTITATSILDSLTKWLTGGASVADFGEQIGAFGSGIKKFAEETSGINPETITAAAKAGEALGNMAKNIPTSGGLWNLIAGKKDIGKFGDQLAKFGPGLKKFDEETKGVNPDTINEAAKAGKNLAEMAKKIPTSGGLWNLIAGEHDLEDFGDQLGKFGGGVKSFAEAVKGTDLGAVESGVAAGKSVAEMAKNLPTTGGLWQLIKGQEGNMTDFALGLVTFAAGIKAFVSEVGGGSAVATACEYIKKFNQVIVEFSTSSVEAISTSVSNSSFTFVSAISSMLQNGINMLTSCSPVFTSAGTYIMVAFASGVLTASVTVTSAFASIITQTLAAISNPVIYAAVRASGKNFAAGFANGILDNTSKVVSAAIAMATAANTAVKAILKICSPSKVSEENGEYYGGAFVDTVADFADKAYAAGSDMATEAVKGLQSASSIINQVLEEGINTQPVITPVIDLSEVQNGVVSLNSMLNGQSIGLSRANSISHTMSIQNGGNDDVISAIKDLRTSIENMSGDTYQINGITVDSGNEIQAAFETILRAAKIERRR